MDASIDGTYAIDKVDAVVDEPDVAITRNEDDGTVTVKVTKADANDDWDTVSAWTNVYVRGEKVRFDPVYSSGTDDAARTFIFMPPFDSSVKLYVKVKNDLGGQKQTSYDVEPIPSKSRIMVNYTDGSDTQLKNGRFYGSKVAAMVFETEVSTDAARESETFMPFGRDKPFATLGDGVEKTVSVKGSIGNTDDGFFEPVPYSGHYDWLAFQKQQGLVLLRMPNTDTYQALCTKMTINQEDEYDETKTVDMSFMEVSV